jgi:hypothetical protein
MNIEGIHVMVESRATREGESSSLHAGVLPEDILSAPLGSETVGSGEPPSAETPVSHLDRVVVEEASGGETPPRVPVSRVFGGRAMALGTAVVPEESTAREEIAADPLLFVPSAGLASSSRDPGITLADTLEGARDEDVARLFQDMEREEVHREAGGSAGGPRLTIVEEVERSLRDRPPFSPETYVPRAHFFIPQGCEVYTPRLSSYPDTEVLFDRHRHISSADPLVSLYLISCSF